jgi:hypothetical protein
MFFPGDPTISEEDYYIKREFTEVQRCVFTPG